MEKLKGILRREKGFTLLELLMVVAIIGILATIVSATVQDSRTAGTDAQVESDGNATDNAQKKYNNESTASLSWPEVKLGTAYNDPDSDGSGETAAGSRKYLDKEGTDITSETKNSADPSGITQDAGISNFEFNHTEIDFAATTNVWQDDGALESQTFVPDYLPKNPASLILIADEGLDDSSDASLFEFL